MSSDGTTKNVYINVGDDRNIKPLSKIDVGTKAKTLLSQNIIMASDIEKEFRQDCLDFFVTAVQYFQSNLPYDVSLLQHAQYIYNCLYKVFGVKNASTNSIVDQVRSQWRFFQNEDIKKESCQLDENEDSSSTSWKKDSYWARAEELCVI